MGTCKYCGNAAGIRGICESCKPIAAAEPHYKNGMAKLKEYSKTNLRSRLEAACTSFGEAAKVGHPEACYQLGLISADYMKDYAKAAVLFSRAIEKNSHPGALYQMGGLFQNELIVAGGVSDPHKAAIEYYIRAEQAGVIEATEQLQSMFFGDKNYEECLNRCVKLINAKRASFDTYRFLGNLYYYGRGVEKNHEASFSYFLNANALEKDNPSVCDYIGYMLFNGLGVKQDYNAARPYLEVGANAGYTSSCYNLGVLYKYGQGGVRKDVFRARDLFEKSVGNGNIGKKEAAYELATLELSGELGSVFFNEKLWKMAADNGCEAAYSKLGLYYYEQKNYKNAAYYIKLAAQQTEDASLYKILGDLYFEGRGVERDAATAKEYYLKVGQYWSGLYYILGSCSKAMNNFSEAVFYYEKALEQGESGPVCVDLFKLYYFPKYNNKNNDIAFSYILRGVERNEPDAAAFLGSCYVNQVGNPGDVEKGIEYLMKAVEDVNTSESNKAYAYKKLGDIYLNGMGNVEPDYVKANSYFKEGRYLGNDACKEGQLKLFIYKEFFNKTENNINKLLEIAKELADSNYQSDCMADLLYQCGNLCVEGNGIPIDLVKAEFFYNEAVKRGNDSAKEGLNTLEEHRVDKYFENIVGFESVRNELKIFYRKMKAGAIKKDERLNFILFGNPGTGKTTVANIIAKFFKDEGICNDKFVEVNATQLASEYTSGKVSNLRKEMEKAEGGVLFIDEAYALYQGEKDRQGSEAVAALLTEAGKKFTLILAGYEKDMQRLYKANQGFARRMGYRITIPNYTNEELVQIAHVLLKADDYTCENWEVADKAIIKAIKKKRTNESTFDNVGTVKEILGNAIDEYWNRNGQGNVLTAEDFGVSEEVTEEEGAQLQKYLDKLNEMIGLQSVKEQVRDMVDLIQYNKMAEAKGKSTFMSSRQHMVFLGNPGTGKTVVARLIGDIYRELGIISGKFVETDRGKLVAGYVGQTALRTAEVLEEATNGILFVDEAYTLYKEDSANDFGKEALETIMKKMEDDAGSLILIMAGYEKEMQDFFNANPGLKSRFSDDLYFRFEDYSAEEMGQILDLILKKNNYRIEAEARDSFIQYLDAKRIAEAQDAKEKGVGSKFGNAREVNKGVEALIKNCNIRVMRNHITDDDLYDLITIDDVKKYTNQ